MTIILTGFTVSIGLIVAIGAQNAWVLGMSVRRCHPWAIASVCFTIDALLMGIGVLFFGRIQQWLPGIVPWLTWVGILMLVWLAFQAALRAWHGSEGLRAGDEGNLSLKQAISIAMAISLLNPHVYLDTVVLIGSLATTSADPWLFWIGAASASVFWFSSLAAIGGKLSVWLVSKRRWQLFDGTISIVMAAVAFSLFQGLYA
jgi:L-lysine exporter family protein LysE/ArgO